MEEDELLVRTFCTIRKGSNVKILRFSERFWIEVQRVSKTGNTIYGIVRNNLVCNKLHDGDNIRFKPEEILELYN